MRHARFALPAALVLAATVATVALVGWREDYQGFRRLSGRLHTTPDGRIEVRGGDPLWDFRRGLLGYAYFAEWERSDGSTRHELVRIDYSRLAATVGLTFGLWVVTAAMVFKQLDRNRP